jgi:hypothetical protein
MDLYAESVHCHDLGAIFGLASTSEPIPPTYAKALVPKEKLLLRAG